MTAFVRRVPAEFDTTYWRVAAGYMERDLGAVSPDEAVRHESPKGFASPAGEVTGQAKDQPYCFAPYDGLRGLGMPDFHDDATDIVDAEHAAARALVRAPVRRAGPSLGETPPAQGSALMRAVPYVIAAAGILYLLNQTAKQTTPSRAR
jgi:hypothetical protein